MIYSFTILSMHYHLFIVQFLTSCYSAFPFFFNLSIVSIVSLWTSSPFSRAIPICLYFYLFCMLFFSQYTTNSFTLHIISYFNHSIFYISTQSAVICSYMSFLIQTIPSSILFLSQKCFFFSFTSFPIKTISSST